MPETRLKMSWPNMRLKGIWLVIFSIAFIILGVILETMVIFPGWSERKVDAFQATLLKKERELNRMIEEFMRDPVLMETGYPSDMGKLWEVMGSIKPKDPTLALYVYYEDSLCCWNNYIVPVNPYLSSHSSGSSFVRYDNVWAVTKQVSAGKLTMVGLIPVKWLYHIQNDLLQQRFSEGFELPPSVYTYTKIEYGSFSIFDHDQNYLFSLVFPEGSGYDISTTYYPAVLYMIAILLLLLAPLRLLKGIRTNSKRNVVVTILIFTLILCRIIMQVYNIPSAFYRMEFFGPNYLAIPVLFPSLGDLFFSVVVLFFCCLYFYHYFTLLCPEKWDIYDRVTPCNVVATVYIVVLLAAFKGILILIGLVVNNSEFVLNSTQIQILSLSGITVYMVFALCIISFLILLEKLYSFCRNRIAYAVLLRWVIALAFLWSVTFEDIKSYSYIVSLLFFISIVSFNGWVKLYRKENMTYASVLFSVVLVSLFLISIISINVEEKKERERKILLRDLANDNDYTAEYLLQGISERMNADSTFISNIIAPKLSGRDMDNLSRYVMQQFFYDGYWDKYDVKIHACKPDDNLVISGSANNCIEYFSSIIKDKGTPLNNSPFYFISNHDGLVTYLGLFKSSDGHTKFPRSLIIELVSKPFRINELGYPQLLIDKSKSGQDPFSGYSYARYYDNHLIDKYGDYVYNLKTEYTGSLFAEEFREYRKNGYIHTVYLSDPSAPAVLVLSNRAFTLYDFLIAFSHVFMIYFLLTSIGAFIVNFPFLRKKITFNFRNKIQTSIVAVLALGFSMIATGTLVFLYWQSNSKHENLILDKIQSMSYDLVEEFDTGILDNPEKYSEEIRRSLVRLANVYSVDINLYSTEGKFIASSRSEVFQQGLLSRLINPVVFRNIIDDQVYHLTIHEYIGTFEYLSAYMPLMNNSYNIKGILNIPYFTRQESFTREITTLVAAVINLYVLLFLITVVISVLLSRQITMPLQMMQNQFSQIQLGHNNAKLQYDQEDELKGLVNEYNRMVDELAKNVELMARSERESAWREMAQQVAHEIKNPLTPMKLSVQHVHKTWMTGDGRFNEMFPKVANRLIEQIDNLSDIATAFSHFASIPFVNAEAFKLKDVLAETVELFDVDGINVACEYNGCEGLMINADRKQIHRLFINILKNALQAIPEERKPHIEIEMKSNANTVTVRVSDNGTGISDEIMDKIFQPNFTTKTSGMGLGLAIVRNITETANGTIKVDTEKDKGTTFWISFPLWKG